jgi:glucose-1-phosphate cytidylyltransferase
MKIVILCGGQGTRLRELTEVQPKPMVEIGERPILWHIMMHYAHHGMNDFVLCLGYKGHQIKRYFLEYQALNSDLTVSLRAPASLEVHSSVTTVPDWRVTLADTGERTMTGSRLARVARYLGDGGTFAVTYGDGLSDVDLEAALSFHRDHGHLATLTGVHPSSRFGELVREGSRVTTFTEKPQAGNSLVNGGFFFFEPGFLRYIDDDHDCVLEREPLQRCAADGELHVYEHHGFWQCMDTLRDWQVLQRLWKTGAAPWKTW